MYTSCGVVGLAAVLSGLAFVSDSTSFVTCERRPLLDDQAATVAIRVMEEDGARISGASVYTTTERFVLRGRTDKDGKAEVRLTPPFRTVIAAEMFRAEVVECTVGQLVLEVKLSRAPSVKISIEGFDLPDERIAVELYDPLGVAFRNSDEFINQARLSVMGVELAREELRFYRGKSSRFVDLRPVRTGPYWFSDVANPAHVEFRLIDALGSTLGESVRARQTPADSLQWNATLVATKPLVRPTVSVRDSEGLAISERKFRVFLAGTESSQNKRHIQLAAETDLQGNFTLPPLAITAITIEESAKGSVGRRRGEIRLREKQNQYEVVVRDN